MENGEVMRISELAKRTGVRVATIKYYLREGLLHPGELSSATQASYDEAHVSRLALIRALLGPAGLSVEAARGVLQVLECPPATLLDALGAAQSAAIGSTDVEHDISDAATLVQRLGWRIRDDSPELRQLAAALRAVQDGGIMLVDGGLERYASAMYQLAEGEIDTVPVDDTPAAVQQVVLGTVLIEPMLLALRRLAQQDVSYRRFRVGAQVD